MSTTEILFKAKIQGTFTREGFIADGSQPTITITKFTDGSFVAKIGNKIIKDRFSTSKGLASLISQHIGINL